VLLDEKAQSLELLLPCLQGGYCGKALDGYSAKNWTKIEQSEVRKILRLAENAPKSRKFKYALKKKPCSAKQCVPFRKCA